MYSRSPVELVKNSREMENWLESPSAQNAKNGSAGLCGRRT